MSTKTNQKTSFSLIKTIMVIMQVDMLKALYKSKFDIDFNMVITKLKFDLLTDEIKEFIKATYNDVILNNEDYFNRYCEVEVHPALKDFDIRARVTVPRRITMEYLENKKNDVGLTDNERMVWYSIKLKQLSTRVHNMGKHGKCSNSEAREVVGAIQTMFKKTTPILEKYGRKGEWNFDEL